MTIATGKTVPNFSVAAITEGGEKTFTQESFKGHWTVLYFYPKDDTPGCTTESKDFRDMLGEFGELNCQIVGVSRDSLQSHQKFADKHELPFTLIADTEEVLCNLLGVIGEKKLYGRVSIGLIRSTFVFDDQGVLRHAWRSVRVANHAQKVLATVRQLQQES